MVETRQGVLYRGTALSGPEGDGARAADRASGAGGPRAGEPPPPGPLEEVDVWLKPFREQWERRFDNLAAVSDLEAAITVLVGVIVAGFAFQVVMVGKPKA